MGAENESKVKVIGKGKGRELPGLSFWCVEWTHIHHATCRKYTEI